MNSTAAAFPENSPPMNGARKNILLHTPLTALIIYCIISVIVRENFPFSIFPMYSNPSAERMYYTISKEDGIGLPVQTLTGTTSPKIGKIYRTKAEKFSKKNNVKPSDFTEAQVASIGLEIIRDLRAKAERNGKAEEFPKQVQLNRIWISYKDGKIVETPLVIAKEPAPKNNLP